MVLIISDVGGLHFVSGGYPKSSSDIRPDPTKDPKGKAYSSTSRVAVLSTFGAFFIRGLRHLVQINGNAISNLSGQTYGLNRLAVKDIVLADMSQYSEYCTAATVS